MSVGAILIAVASLSGPFGTFQTLSMGGRFVYWVLAISGIGLTMNLVFYVMLNWPPLKSIHVILRIALGAAIAAPVGGMIIMLLDVWTERDTYSMQEVLNRAHFVFMIGFIIGLSEEFLRPLWHHDAPPAQPVVQDPTIPDQDVPQQPPAPPPPEVETPAPPTEAQPLFLRNLDPKLGKDLISISTEDHYLKIVTRDGQDKILKRMSDAVAELGDFPGLQIHRSHWIALNAVARVERDGRKCHVVLENGETLPVSRPNIPVLTAALEARA